MREEVGREIESVPQVEACDPMASLRDFGQPKVRDLLTTTKNSVVRPKEKKRREGGEVRCEKRMKGNERSEGKRERSKREVRE